MGYYDVAQICLSGHMVNDSANSRPTHNQDYCDKCGEKTIRSCPHCNKSIQGDYHCDVVAIGYVTPSPAYCIHCGEAFPWTERRINAAIALSVEGGGLSEEDAGVLKQSLDDMSRDNPEAQLGAVRFNKLMKKIPVTIAKAVRDVAVEVVAESISKTISGGSK